MKTIRFHARSGLSALLLLSFAASSLAQNTSPAPAAVATSGETVVLDSFKVTDVPLDEQIMPTVRPLSSVLGDSRNILDTPRSVTSVNKELMNQIRVRSFLDLQQFTSSVQSTQRYGTAATPSIRGDLSAVYYNGQQSKYTYNDVPVSFNGVEAMDIVKGSGSAVFGPQNYGAAGYVNFVTKEPYFNQQHTEVGVAYGTMGKQGFSNTEYFFDTGGPITTDTAYRVSYLGRTGDEFYLDTKNETQDVFVALTHRFDNDTKLRFWTQYYRTRFNDISGINYVTQDLVDNSIYTFNGVRKIKIDANNVLSGPLDYAIARRFQAQAIFEKNYGSTTLLKNSTSYEDRSHEKYNPSTSYSQYVPKDTLLQNRTELHTAFNTGAIEHKAILGADLKREQVLAYLTFLTETYTGQDLSGPRSAFAKITPAISAYAVPGHPEFGTDLGYYNVFFYGDFPNNQDTTLNQASAFYQHDVKFNRVFSAVAGVRVDYIDADSKNPAYIERANNALFAAGSLYKQSGSRTNGSYYGSLIAKLNPRHSLYVTYNENAAVLGSNHFGGVGINANNNEDFIAALHSKAKLAEAGYKGVFWENRVFVAAAVYDQTRADPDRFGKLFERRSKGFEFETVIQASKRFYFLGNVTSQDITRKDTAGNVSRTRGTSRWLANARFNVKFDSGFGAGIGPQFAGSQIGSGTTTIPTQYRIDATLYYQTKKWEVQVNIFNLTDQENWSMMDTEFDGGTAVKERPLGLSVTTRYRF